MTNLTTPTVRGYLADLNRVLRDVPHGRREEVTRDIRAHIDSALVDTGDQSPAMVASILDQLGPPEEIAAAARAELPMVEPRMATRDVATIVLLLVGGFVLPFIGWAIGVVLLWTSEAWRVRNKIVATLLVPGGLLGVLLLAGLEAATTNSCASDSPGPDTAGQVCTESVSGIFDNGHLHILALIVIIGGSLFIAFWLAQHARRLRVS